MSTSAPVMIRWLTLLAVAGALAHAAPIRPNVVLIMTDDQGYGDLGITGNPVLETPHLDALAAGAASMSQFYVSPVCSPTRACLMTGRYNYRTRVIDTFKGRSMMDPAEVTVAEVLGRAGYATGIFGKWHLGDAYPLRPIDQGFEEALVHRGGGLAQPSEPIENRNRYTDPILLHNGEKVQTRGYCTDVYFTAALRFMKQALAEGRPFFTYIAPNTPHGPFHDVPEVLYEKYRTKDLTDVLRGNAESADTVARVYAMVENIDENVGRLMTVLRELGQWQNTVVVFMVDNGPNTRRYVGPMRGMKSEVHEGGIRSPFYVQWPARLQPGVSSDRIAAHIDVMPTLLEAAGVRVPRGLRLDGRSLLPLLEGRDVPWPDRTLVIQSHRGDVPVAFHHVAIRDQRWKLVHPSGFGREVMPGEVPVELYDMAMDPGEVRNVAREFPGEVARLRGAYERWFEDVAHTRPDNFDAPRMVVGTAHESTTVLTWQDWRVLESAGWGKQGLWKLRVEQAGLFDAILRWPEPVRAAKLRLDVDGTEHVGVVEEGQTQATLLDIPLPRGDRDLRIDVERDAETIGPYQVVLQLKRPGP